MKTNSPIHLYLRIFIFSSLILSVMQTACVRQSFNQRKNTSTPPTQEWAVAHSWTTPAPFPTSSPTPFQPVTATPQETKQAVEPAGGQARSQDRLFLPHLNNSSQPAEPVVEPPPAQAIFSATTANHVLPEDVLEEISFVGGGGGGHCPSITNPPNPPHHELVELTYAMFWMVCGWETGEVAEAIIERPDGRVDRMTLREGEGPSFSSMGGMPGIVQFDYPTRLADPLGWYRLTLSGNSGRLQAYFYVKPTQDPGLLLQESGRLLFYQFEPNERVRLLAYRQKDSARGQFIAWQEFQMGPDGQLPVDHQIDSPILVAIGSNSGEVRARPEGKMVQGLGYLSFPSIQKIKCTYQKRAKYQPGERVRPRYQLPLWNGTFPLDDPSTANKYDAEVREGELLTVLDGPLCNAVETVSWRVQTSSGLTGWISDYFIEKYPALDPACSASPLPRLSPGRQGRVTYTNGRPVNVHDGSPGLQAPKVRALEEGAFFFVLEGPRCLDVYYWWLVRDENNLDGWVAEGDQAFYFIEPMPD